MTSIDDLLRAHAPGGKRKLSPPPSFPPSKVARVSSASPSPPNSPGSDASAGPELPPSDDEEGRFYGSGLGASSLSALDYISAAPDAPLDVPDAAWARRLAGSLEKAVVKNAEQRARWAEEPQRFMASEADLDDEIRAVSALTDSGELYPVWAAAGGAKALVGCLAHENVDVAISAAEVLAELLGEDVEVEEEDWRAVVEDMLDGDLVGLLYGTLERLDEKDEGDRQGVYHCLAVFEALAGNTSVREQVGTEDVLRWLVKRVQVKEEQVGQNKQYAAEVLQVFLQESKVLRERALAVEAADCVLGLLATYRRKDPENNSLEEEYVGNLFNALVCLVQNEAGKQAFVAGEGVELMLIMLREGKMSKTEALKVLDHATVAGQTVCEKIVEAAGLKTLFGLFKKKLDRQATENLLDIFSAMLRYLPGESAERIRLLAKFSEKGYDKVSKLLEWRGKFVADLARVDAEVSRERAQLSEEDQEERADEWDLRRLDAGLFALQTTNIVLAWLCAEDKDARAKLVAEGVQPEQIRAGLSEQLGEVDAKADPDLAEMLQALIEAL